jgi:hypothetical protein
MKKSTILKKALKLLGPRGGNWGKESYYNVVKGKEKWCSVGAINCINAPFEERSEALDYLETVLKVNSFEYIKISRWNDAAKNFKEIKKGFEAAIKLAKSMGE